MKLTRNEDGTYTFEREQGWIALTADEVACIVNQSNKIGLRIAIEHLIREMDGDTIDLSNYPYTFEEFVDEAYIDLEEQLDYGTPPDDEDIKSKIQDIADYYEINRD